MATIKVKWVVDELANVLTQFDVCKVYWSATKTGTYAEATGPATRVTLVSGQSLYYFDHTSGDPTYWYKVSYYNSTTTQESDLSDPFQAGNAGGYVSVDDVRAIITADPPTDATIAETIVQWSQFIDLACQQWFEPRYLELEVDGSGARYLWLQVPIIGVDELYMNADFTNAVNAEFFEVYNNLGEGLSDDRRNPRIGLADKIPRSIYTSFSRSDIFVEGKKNQYIKGTFGFVEADGSTPALIQRAVLKLVVRQLSATDSLNPDPGPSGPIVSETTDAHTIRYGAMFSSRRAGTYNVTGDAEVEGIIALYKRPKAMAVAS